MDNMFKVILTASSKCVAQLMALRVDRPSKDYEPAGFLRPGLGLNYKITRGAECNRVLKFCAVVSTLTSVNLRPRVGVVAAAGEVG